MHFACHRFNRILSRMKIIGQLILALLLPSIESAGNTMANVLPMIDSFFPFESMMKCLAQGHFTGVINGHSNPNHGLYATPV